MAINTNNSDPDAERQAAHAKELGNMGMLIALGGGLFGAGSLFGDWGSGLFKRGINEEHDEIGPDGRPRRNADGSIRRRPSSTSAENNEAAQKLFSAIKTASADAEIPQDLLLKIASAEGQVDPLSISEGAPQTTLDTIKFMEGTAKGQAVLEKNPKLRELKTALEDAMQRFPDTQARLEALKNGQLNNVISLSGDAAVNSTIKAFTVRRKLEQQYQYNPDIDALVEAKKPQNDEERAQIRKEILDARDEQMRVVGGDLYLTSRFGESTAKKITENDVTDTATPFFSDDDIKAHPDLAEFKGKTAHQLVNWGRDQANVDLTRFYQTINPSTAGNVKDTPEIADAFRTSVTSWAAKNHPEWNNDQLTRAVNNYRAFVYMTAKSEASNWNIKSGGGTFDISPGSQHPGWGRWSTAAGLPQFLTGTWDDIRKQHTDITDFTPANQIKAMGYLIEMQGKQHDKTFENVLLGNFDQAVGQTNGIWASYTGGKQANWSIEQLRNFYYSYGGLLPGQEPAAPAASANLVASSGVLAPPLENIDVSSKFGHRDAPVPGASTEHMGTDFRAPLGTKVFAPGDGVVVASGYARGYGNHYLRIRYGDDVRQVFKGQVEDEFGHMSDNANLKVGDRVTKGQVIGLVGMEGVHTGPHLHYGKLVNNEYVDPMKYMGSGPVLAAAGPPRLDLARLFNMKPGSNVFSGLPFGVTPVVARMPNPGTAPTNISTAVASMMASEYGKTQAVYNGECKPATAQFVSHITGTPISSPKQTLSEEYLEQHGFQRITYGGNIRPEAGDVIHMPSGGEKAGHWQFVIKGGDVPHNGKTITPTDALYMSDTLQTNGFYPGEAYRNDRGGQGAEYFVLRPIAPPTPTAAPQSNGLTNAAFRIAPTKPVTMIGDSYMYGIVKFGGKQLRLPNGFDSKAVGGENLFTLAQQVTGNAGNGQIIFHSSGWNDKKLVHVSNSWEPQAGDAVVKVNGKPMRIDAGLVAAAEKIGQKLANNRGVWVLPLDQTKYGAVQGIDDGVRIAALTELYRQVAAKYKVATIDGNAANLSPAEQARLASNLNMTPAQIAKANGPDRGDYHISGTDYKIFAAVIHRGLEKLANSVPVAAPPTSSPTRETNNATQPPATPPSPVQQVVARMPPDLSLHTFKSGVSFPLASRPIEGNEKSHPGERHWHDTNKYGDTAEIHTASDFAAKVNSPLLAGEGGKVLVARYHPYYGNLLVYERPNGQRVHMAHLASIGVKEDSTFNPGDTLGTSGGTGLYGKGVDPHLHLGLQAKDGSILDVRTGQLVTRKDDPILTRDERQSILLDPLRHRGALPPAANSTTVSAPGPALPPVREAKAEPQQPATPAAAPAATPVKTAVAALPPAPSSPSPFARAVSTLQNAGSAVAGLFLPSTAHASTLNEGVVPAGAQKTAQATPTAQTPAGEQKTEKEQKEEASSRTVLAALHKKAKDVHDEKQKKKTIANADAKPHRRRDRLHGVEPAMASNEKKKGPQRQVASSAKKPEGSGPNGSSSALG